MRYEKGTFITIPNKEILKGKPSEMQVIYMWLNDHTDAYGRCFPGRRTLAKECGVGLKTLDKYVNELILLGLVNKTTRNKPNSKEKMSNLYQIMIIQGENLPEVPLTPPSTEMTPTPSSQIDPVTKPIINQTHLTSSAEAPIKVFNPQEELEKLLNYNIYWMNILGVYIKKKRISFTTRKQLDTIIGRWVKTAKSLEVFERNQIVESMKKCEEMVDSRGNKIDWNLMTVFKKLT